MPNAARIGHELTEIRDDSPRFVRFSLMIVIKKGPYMLQGDISSKMNVPRKAAEELILQLEFKNSYLYSLKKTTTLKSRDPDNDSLTWENMAVRYWQNHQPGATD